MKAIRGPRETIRIEDVPVKKHDPSAKRRPIAYENHLDALSAPVNQGLCGSCWAISTTQCLRDRINRKRKTLLVPQLSFQFVIDCATNCVTYQGREGCSLDCNGGFLTTSYEFLKVVGTVREEFHPNRHDDESGIDHIDGTSGSAKTCPDSIPESEPVYKCLGFYNVHLYPDMFGITNARLRPRLRSPDQLKANADNIAEEIFLNGPVAVCFNLFSDFRDFWMHPDSSKMVYQIGWKLKRAVRDTIDPVGDIRWGTEIPAKYGISFKTGHSVSIVGFGVQKDDEGNNVDYWICRNSWGYAPNTLHNGYFKIRRGINSSAIEADVCACTVAEPPPEALIAPDIVAPAIVAPVTEQPALSLAGAAKSQLTAASEGKEKDWGIYFIIAIMLLCVFIYLWRKPKAIMAPPALYLPGTASWPL
jgi:hypothetical protein